MSRVLRIGALAAGVAIAGLSTWGALIAPERQSGTLIALRTITGLVFVIVGAFFWWRRPRNNVGVLLTAVGLTWYIYDLHWIDSSLAFTVADMEGGLYLAVLGHLVLAFPSGRLRGSLDRVVTAVIYLWAIAGNVIPEVIWAPPRPTCDCPHNLLGLRTDAAHYVFAGSAHQVVNAALTLVVFALLVQHWWTATRPGRRALGPVAWASGPILVAVIGLQTVGIIESLSPLQRVLPYLTPIALMTLPASIVVGRVRSNLARLAVGRLVVDLGDAPHSDLLRDGLARTFHDPSLQIVYWVDASSEYVDGDGRSVVLPEPGSGRAATLLQRHGTPMAAIVHDASLEDDPALMETVTATASLALENERLIAAVRAQLTEVQASRARIVTAADAARRRIERDLHDGAQQNLVTASLGLRMAIDQLASAQPDSATATLERTADQLRLAISELRELAAGIHPTILTEAGLGPALESLADRAPVPTTVHCACTERLPKEIEAAAYFVVSEAITNAGKHARAGAVAVNVSRENGLLHVEIKDDGVGGAKPARGSGLLGLSDRVAALEGRLQIISPADGGTRLVAEIPCE